MARDNILVCKKLTILPILNLFFLLVPVSAISIKADISISLIIIEVWRSVISEVGKSKLIEAERSAVYRRRKKRSIKKQKEVQDIEAKRSAGIEAERSVVYKDKSTS